MIKVCRNKIFILIKSATVSQSNTKLKHFSSDRITLEVKMVTKLIIKSQKFFFLYCNLKCNQASLFAAFLHVSIFAKDNWSPWTLSLETVPSDRSLFLRSEKINKVCPDDWFVALRNQTKMTCVFNCRYSWFSHFGVSIHSENLDGGVNQHNLM